MSDGAHPTMEDILTLCRSVVESKAGTQYALLAQTVLDLHRWKCEAMSVWVEWDEVAKALGLDNPRPRELGRSIAKSALVRVRELQAK